MSNNKALQEIIEQDYLNGKKTVIEYLKELVRILESSNEPLSGDDRKMFMDKFSFLDRRLIDRYDVAAWKYFELLESKKEKTKAE